MVTKTICRALCVLILPLALLNADALTQVVGQEVPSYRKSLPFAAGPAPENYDNLRTWLSHVDSSTPGKELAFGAKLTPDSFSRIKHDCPIFFPPLEKGAIVPVCGYLYRVSKLEQRSPLKGTRGSDYMLLQKVKDEDLADDLRVQNDSYAVPLGSAESPACIFVQTFQIAVLRIEARMNKRQEMVAQMSVRRAPAYFLKDQETADVRRNDILVINSQGFKVRNIVPFSATSGAIGWVELASTPIPKEDLAKQRSVVYPERSK